MHSISALVVLACVLMASCSGGERKGATAGDSAKSGAAAAVADSVGRSGVAEAVIDSFAEPPLAPAMRTALATWPNFVPWKAQDFADRIRRSYHPDAENGLWWIVGDFNGDFVDDVALSGRDREANPMVIALLSHGDRFIARGVYQTDARPGDQPIILRAPGGGIELTDRNSSPPILMFWNGERFLVREGP